MRHLVIVFTVQNLRFIFVGILCLVAIQAVALRTSISGEFYKDSGLSATAVGEEIDWPSLALTQIAGSPTMITHVANAGDGSGRLFFVERSGRIRIFDGSNVLSEPFLDISPAVSGGIEDGMFSVAFAPDFRSSGEFYVNYTRRPDTAVVLSRFKVGSNPEAASTNEQVLLVVPHPGPIHNGGSLAFGPDGFLYLGIGDAGSSSNSQSGATLLGKMLRVDVAGGGANYAIPDSNPFVNMPGSRPEIWALGLRNPWRSSFDAVTGDFYIADVGERDREEVNFQNALSRGGENYGWPFFEGNLTRNIGTNITDIAAYTFPVTEYDRFLGGSVTGGEVHHGTEAERMRGIYFFGDWGSGRIWGLKRNGGNWERRELFRGTSGITTFGSDEAGNLYVAISSGATSRVSRLVDDRRTFPPGFSLTAGFPFTSDQVVLTSATPGARIHYRRDGVEPTEQDLFVIAGQSIAVTTNQTIMARAFRDDLQPSGVSSNSFHLAPVLEFDPPASPVTNGTLLTITSKAKETTIRYTLDGSEVTEASPVYTEPIPLTGNQTVNARGFKTNWNPSTPYTFYYGFLDPEFVAIRTFAGSGVRGHADGPALQAKFNVPSGLFIDSSDNIYISEWGNNAVRKISPDGEVSTVYQGGLLEDAVSVALDADGTIFVADWQGGIVKIPTKGAAMKIATELHSPRFLEVDPAGNVFVADGGIYRIAPDGTVTPVGDPNFSRFEGIGLAPNGDIFASSNSQIFRLQTNGITEVFAGATWINFDRYIDGPRLEAEIAFDNMAARDITFDAFGNMYFGDFSRIRKITVNGRLRTLVRRSGSTLDSPIRVAYGIGVDSKGNIYVAEAQSDKIRKIAPDADRDGILDTEEGPGTPFLAGENDLERDADNDGIDNATEYILGSDPEQASEPFQLTISTTEGGVSLQWPTAPGRSYRIEQSRDLHEWVFSGQPIPGTGFTFRTNAAVSSNIFYRVSADWN